MTSSSTILVELLSGLAETRFIDEVLGSKPFACADAASRIALEFGWKEFDRLLDSSNVVKDTLVVRRGEVLSKTAPRNLESLKALFAQQAGVVIRQAEKHSDHLRQLAMRFGDEMGNFVTLQVFATPSNSHSFGWHYDFEHVFIVQTQGVKDYYFRANTVDPCQSPTAQPDFSVYAREKSPLLHARLHRADWLYLPPRWWHMAKCRQSALSVSMGLRAETSTT